MTYAVHKAGLSAPRVAEALGCGLRTVFRLKADAPWLWIREPTPVRPGRGTPQPRLPADALPVLRAMLAERASRDNLAKAREMLARQRLAMRRLTNNAANRQESAKRGRDCQNAAQAV